MICPSCRKGIRFEVVETTRAFFAEADRSKRSGWDVQCGQCPECEALIVVLRRGRFTWGEEYEPPTIIEVLQQEILHPQPPPRSLQSPDVPEGYRRDFDEAAAVLPTSPKASAAISRRLLQHILREELALGPSDLSKEIDALIETKTPPSYIADAIDAVRQVGNLAAHPLKDRETGQVVEVEPGEAEWLLDVLEALFDWLFVQPRKLERKREQLDAKLAALGKPPMKRTHEN